MNVTQVLCAAGPVDAVTNQGLACRALFRSWGWDGADYAPVIAPGLDTRAIRHLHELERRPDHVLLLHYSGYARGLEQLLEDFPRSLLISHNITPAGYFWEHEPYEAVRCELARSQLASLSLSAGALAGVSDYNARELRELSHRDADVIPVLFDRSRLGSPGAAPSGPPVVLFVGRLVPHKRQDLVIRAFARLRRHRPDARLVLIGTPMSEDYRRQLEQLAEELAPGAVSFESGIAPERLAQHYRAAHAFLCLSEHEGFCIPLLEAFHYGVPVVAREQGAIGEVLGDAGVLLSASDSLETIAQVMRIVIEDAELRDELRSRGERRLEQYALDRTAARLRDRLSALVTR